MPATAFAAIAAFEQVFFGKHNIAFGRGIEILGLQVLFFRKSTQVVCRHCTKVAIVIKNGRVGEMFI